MEFFFRVVYSTHISGVIRISSDRDDRRILLGLKFSISEFFWVAWFIKVGIFLDIQTALLKIRDSSRISRLRSSSGNFYGL